MEINSIVKSLLLRFPLFGNVVVNLKFTFTNQQVNAPAFTDGRYIYYKQEFIDDYTFDEQVFIVAHEIFHVVLKHIFRNVGRDEDLLNYVEDGIINQLLIKNGLELPQGLVNIPDALDYSTEELYMKYLPQLDEIKKWMNENTYHVEIVDFEDWINEMFDQDMQDLMSDNDSLRNGKLNNDLQDLVNANETLRNEMLSDIQNQLKAQAQFGSMALGLEFPSIDVGHAAPLLYWKELLRANINTPNETTTAFYETEMDGILRKEVKSTPSRSDSEIIIDSSGSMDMQKIKAILRECKNILHSSNIKVGFCDVQFYGWHEIRNESDIDNLQIIGRGGTSFDDMANSFSENADNKIVLTDGLCTFPKDRPDILWVIINNYDPRLYVDDGKSNINSIFINERDIPVFEKSKKLALDLK